MSGLLSPSLVGSLSPGTPTLSSKVHGTATELAGADAAASQFAV